MVARILLLGASVYTIVLTAASLVKLGKISVGSFSPTDKLLHTAAYLGLVVIWKFFFIFKEDPAEYRKNLLKISGVAILFGMFIELLQGVLTNYREPDWFDIFANSLGVLIAVLLFLFFQGSLQRLKSKINLVF